MKTLTIGEDVFLGVSPVWDEKERVTGLAVMGLEELGRPRIDATVRITGVYRDTYPSAVAMMDDAVLMVAALDESDEDNYLLKHLRAYAENLNSAAEETIFNPFWLENIKSCGYDSASEIMNVAQNIFSMQCLADCFSDEMLDKLTRQIVNNEKFRAWFSQHNPYALEEIARRMLELNQRGKWKPDGETLEELKRNYLLIEGDMEARVGNGEGIQAGSVDIITDADVDSWKQKIGDVLARISRGQQ